MERMNTWGGFYELGSQSSSRSSLSSDEAQPESILPGFGNRCSLTAEGAAELLVSLHHLDAQRCLQNPQPVPNKKGKEQKVCSDCGCKETCFWRRDRATGLPLCNACGLFLAKHKHHRPASLSRRQ